MFGQRFGPDAQHSLLDARGGRQLDVEATGFGGLALDADGDEVHGRAADEAGDVHVRGLVIDLARRGYLLQDAVLHHRDAVSHRHRLDLVVGHIYEGRVERAVLFLQLDPRLHAQLGVEVRQWLVEEEGLWLTHDGAAERDTLPLAA